MAPGGDEPEDEEPEPGNPARLGHVGRHRVVHPHAEAGRISSTIRELFGSVVDPVAPLNGRWHIQNCAPSNDRAGDQEEKKPLRAPYGLASDRPLMPAMARSARVTRRGDADRAHRPPGFPGQVAAIATQPSMRATHRRSAHCERSGSAGG